MFRNLIAMSIALSSVLVAVVSARDDSSVRRNVNNMQQVAFAMLVYHDMNKSLPPAVVERDGKPLLSWRVLLLPYLDDPKAKSLYDEFHLDEPWDSAHNRPLVAKMPDVYKSPNSKHTDGRTVYLTPRGEKTAFPGTRVVQLRQVLDGTAKTLALLEVDDDRAVEWTKPDDWRFDPKNPTAGLGGQTTDGYTVAMLDSSIHYFPKSVDGKTLNKLLTMNGRETVELPQW